MHELHHIRLDLFVCNYITIYFVNWALCVCREPEALQLLIQLYVERNHMLWKIPEVCSQSGLVFVDGDAFDVVVAHCMSSRCLYFAIYMYFCVCIMLTGLNMAGNQCQGYSTEVQGL